MFTYTKTYLTFIFMLVSSSSYGLVDYSDKSADSFVPSSEAVAAPKQQVITKRMPPPSNRTAKAQASSGMFNMKVGMDSNQVKLKEASAKVTSINMQGRFETNYNVFLDFSYWGRASEDRIIARRESYQKGNPKVLLGINFLNFGEAAERSTLDFYGGVNFKESGSEFAHSKSDKIVGLELSKRFYEFVLGLSADFRMAGTPSVDEEMETGNILHLEGAIGVRVSPDIRFGVEAGTYQVKNANSSDRDLKLAEDLSFGYVRPVLGLNLGLFFQMELGALFRTKRLTDKELLKARLWDLKGSYGNSLFVNLVAAL